MTVTKKQIAANRQNAQKSTGPTTPEGKAKASKNALKYGFNAKDMILNTPVFNENPAEYEALLDSLYEELKPATALQEYLVRKIANSLWRSRRILLAETAQINDQLEYVESGLERHRSLTSLPRYESSPDDQIDYEMRERINAIARKLIPREDVNINSMRYELRLDRQLTRSIRLLKFLKLYKFDENETGLPEDIVENDITDPNPGNTIADN